MYRQIQMEGGERDVDIDYSSFSFFSYSDGVASVLKEDFNMLKLKSPIQENEAKPKKKGRIVKGCCRDTEAVYWFKKEALLVAIACSPPRASLFRRSSPWHYL